MSTEPALNRPRGILGALWIYQRERFPLVAYVPLVTAFSLSALAYANQGGAGSLASSPGALLEVAINVLSVLAVFFLMRIADEFKDASDDARYRPYRPVPRGLVSLRELGALAAILVAILVLVHLLWAPEKLVYLALVLGYLGLMSVEFGVSGWLKGQPALYAASHMVILALIAGYAASSFAAWPFLALAYSNGVVLEVGRKVRAPVDEEPGVETYSSLYGTRRALGLWAAAVVASASIAVAALEHLAHFGVFATVIGLAAVACLSVGHAFLRRCDSATGGRIEIASGVWLLITFFIVGLAAAVDTSATALA
jgi:4-hydroxybenzoate polyprenyltransferase